MENNLMGLHREEMDVLMDQKGNPLSTFELSVADFTAELAAINGFDRVEVTLDNDDPGKVLLNFRRDADSGSSADVDFWC
jgi:hypothetical protein